MTTNSRHHRLGHSGWTTPVRSQHQRRWPASESPIRVTARLTARRPTNLIYSDRNGSAEILTNEARSRYQPGDEKTKFEQADLAHLASQMLSDMTSRSIRGALPVVLPRSLPTLATTYIYLHSIYTSGSRGDVETLIRLYWTSASKRMTFILQDCTHLPLISINPMKPQAPGARR